MTPSDERGTFGPDFDEATDGEAVRTQMERVRQFMLLESVMHRWDTLAEISARLEEMYLEPFPESSVSAQLRHLRKPAFGSYRVEKRRRGRQDQKTRLWEYRLLHPAPKPKAGQGLLFETHPVR